ncbi:hypothetical protein LIER_10719 [Lithospermum erythrorhizon]|uniref:Uncharacterized protein n=1 Tax=Lithospermum erythrorhizon TaxID=34254 RepID=A0AAV3PQH6_LITER
MVRAFLWKGVAQGRYATKVSWSTLSLPKEEGGLGIKNLKLWNQACMAQYLSDISSHKESLWIKWVVVFRLKGRSLWSIFPKSTNC